MINYIEKFEEETGKHLGDDAKRLTPLFEEIRFGNILPPKGQQAVDCGFIAHTFNDPRENPLIYTYYHWVIENIFADTVIRELPAKIIGDEFICANIFETDWPQPLTVNKWQLDQVLTAKLMAKKAVVIENNGVFIWLLHRHPDWPLILQSGNNFNVVYRNVMKMLSHKVKLSYLGDLDTEGIKIVDLLTTMIDEQGCESRALSALQNLGQVANWVAVYGVSNESTKRIHYDETIMNPVWQEEANFLEINHQFVEQEQLIREYERIIPEWLSWN